MSQIREINVENVVEFLNSNDYSLDFLQSAFYKRTRTGFSSKDYVQFINNFTDFFFDEKQENECEITNRFVGTKIHINENKSGTILRKLTKLTYNRMYPVIISNLYKSGEIEFAINELGEIYSFCVYNYNYIAKNKDIKQESRLLLKYFLNYMYGISNNPIRPMGVTKVSKVIDYYRKAVVELSKIPEVIYVDVDTIYFEESVTNKIKKVADDLNIPYEIEHGISGFFVQKKKYVSLKGNDIVVMGIDVKKLKDYGPYKDFNHVVSIFQQELLSKKINKLKDLCVKEVT